MKNSPDCEHLLFPAEFKLVGEPTSEDGGTVEGYAAVFDRSTSHHDSGDFVEPGAFKKTIQERVNKGLVPYLDSHQWSVAHTIGRLTGGAEDSKGFHYRARLSKAPSAQEARLKMKEGVITHNSIGFRAVRENYQPTEEARAGGMRRMARHLRELKLFEVSAVPVADDDLATNSQVMAVTTFEDLPLAARDRSWDASAARARVKTWAGGTDINWARYRRAFLWYDREKPDEADSYKLPIADVIDGELTAIPRGIFAAAAVLQGARGGAEIEGDEEAVKSHLARYYAKMAHQFKDDSIVAPWNKHSIDSLVLEAKSIGVYDVAQMREAASELLSVMTPADRASVLRELSAGPGIPPTEGAEAAFAALKRRGQVLKSELDRRF